MEVKKMRRKCKMEKIEKSSYGFTEGVMIGQMKGKMSTTGFREVDWKKAKEYIESNKEKISSVTIGLAEDWTYTSDEVWNSEDGYAESANVYACSNWATPSMTVDYVDGTDETFECWHYGNNSDSYFE